MLGGFVASRYSSYPSRAPPEPESESATRSAASTACGFGSPPCPVLAHPGQLVAPSLPCVVALARVLIVIFPLAELSTQPKLVNGEKDDQRQGHDTE